MSGKAYCLLGFMILPYILEAKECLVDPENWLAHLEGVCQALRKEPVPRQLELSSPLHRSMNGSQSVGQVLHQAWPDADRRCFGLHEGGKAPMRYQVMLAKHMHTGEL